MNIREISKPVTAASLNESLAKRFGSKIDLEKFTLEQLQDARNKLRTQLSQVETTESYDKVHSSESYQKSKLFLDVLNAAVTEKEAMPDHPDVDGDGDTDEPISQAQKDKEDKDTDSEPKDLSKVPPQLRKHMQKDEGKEIINNYFQTLVEGEEDKAEIVMAAKDMVDRITGWMEDTAEMESESMLNLGDAIRDEMGEAQSQSFIQTVKPALESLYTALESTRGSLTSGVSMLTGEGEPAQDMGAENEMPDGEAEPEAEMEPTVDAEAEEESVEDEFGASETAAGGEEEAGREKRESKIQNKKMIETSRRLGTILSSKKK